MKKLILICLPVALLSLIVTMCNPKDDEPANKSFDRKTMLENIASNLILPAYEDFSSEAQQFEDATLIFTEDITEANLKSLQDHWKKLATSWSYCMPYNYIGPAYDSSFITRINNFPANAVKIEDNIGTESIINEQYIESLGSKEKGLPAVEYLIFAEENTNALLEKYINDGSEKRKEYLKALSENIRIKADDLLYAWSPQGANYYATFISATGTDASSATNQLANSIIQSAEYIKNIKIGYPLGKKSAEGVEPEMTEAYYSKYSLELIESNLDAIEKVFNGNSSQNGLGFDDYLDYVNAKWQDNQTLSQRINQQFSSIRTTLSDIDTPLDEAVLNEAMDVDKSFNAYVSLIALLKGEMTSKLGITISYTDNDGD